MAVLNMSSLLAITMAIMCISMWKTDAAKGMPRPANQVRQHQDLECSASDWHVVCSKYCAKMPGFITSCTYQAASGKRHRRSMDDEEVAEEDRLVDMDEMLDEERGKKRKTANNKTAGNNKNVQKAGKGKGQTQGNKKKPIKEEDKEEEEEEQQNKKGGKNKNGNNQENNKNQKKGNKRQQQNGPKSGGKEEGQEEEKMGECHCNRMALPNYHHGSGSDAYHGSGSDAYYGSGSGS